MSEFTTFVNNNNLFGLRYTILFSIVFLAFFSCESKKEKNTEGDEEKIYSQSLLAVKKVYKLEQYIDPSVVLKLADWKQYKRLADFVETNYLNTSANQSFEMSKELVDNIQVAKDSLRIKELRKLGVFARLNTLYSEAVRLKDMSTISSIKANEVEVQTQKIVSIFSSINAKINAVYEQQNFDESIEFDEEIFNFREEPELKLPKSQKRIKKRNAVLANQKKVK